MHDLTTKEGRKKAAQPAFAILEFDRLCDLVDQKDAEIAALKVENAALRNAYFKVQVEVCGVLGRALGYPWYKDDQKNFPGATEGDGVCTGEHVAETIAAEAAERIAALKAERDRMREALQKAKQWIAFRDTSEILGEATQVSGGGSILLQQIAAVLSSTKQED